MAIVAGIKSIQNELENSLLWSYVAPSVLNIFKQIEQYYKNPSTLKNMEKAPAPVPTIPYLGNTSSLFLTLPVSLPLSLSSY
jgi:hypothetical protein